jgi:hypothetical protein
MGNYWFEFQTAMDKQARYCLLAVPSATRPNQPVYAGNQMTGVLFRGTLHRFDITTHLPSCENGVRASNRVDAFGAPFQFRCTPIPYDLHLQYGNRPPPQAWDWTRSQRLAATDVEFTIGQDSNNRIMGLGVGRTYPIFGREEPTTRIALNGSIVSASGAFANKLGMFVISGLFTPPNKFQLSVLIMVRNPGALVTQSPVQEIQPAADLPLHATYLLINTYAPSFTATNFLPFGAPQPTRIEAAELIRHYTTQFATSGSPVCRDEYGKDIGTHDVTLGFSPNSAPPSQGVKQPTFDIEHFHFTDNGTRVGSIQVANDEIRSVPSSIDGIPNDIQPQLLIAGFGPVDWGHGCFAGLQGFQTNVAYGTTIPHLTSLTYLIEIADPIARFRA